MNKKNRFILTIGCILTVGFLGTSLASYFISRASLRTEITSSELPLTSDNVYSEIQRDLLRPIFISSLMASDTFLRDWVLQGEQEPERIVRYLREIKEKYNTFSSFFVSDITRNYYYGEGILKQVSEEEERDRWYFRVREIIDEYEVNVDQDMANADAMTIFINYKVYDYDGNYIGATGVGLTVNAVKQLIEKYQEKYSHQIFFINREGGVTLAGSDFPGDISNIFRTEKYGDWSDSILIEKENSFHFSHHGEILHVNVRYIPEFDWYLIIERSEKKIVRDIFNVLVLNLVICIIITAIILTLIILIINGYQKRIETLRGIVPICSYCKQIRDDKGYWNQVEQYIEKHTEAEFSHGICPKCLKEFFDE